MLYRHVFTHFKHLSSSYLIFSDEELKKLPIYQSFGTWNHKIKRKKRRHDRDKEVYRNNMEMEKRLVCDVFVYRVNRIIISAKSTNKDKQIFLNIIFDCMGTLTIKKKSSSKKIIFIITRKFARKKTYVHFSKNTYRSKHCQASTTTRNV